MSNRDKNMFRNEQRFSFRKYSFGLASALIANVVFGATIAGGPLVHADTDTEVATLTSSSSQQSDSVDITDESTNSITDIVTNPVDRLVTLTYTVNVVDKDGVVLKTEEKSVEVSAGEGLASIVEELGQELIPVDYKLVDGLGQVRVVENQENIFTVTVEKVVTEPVVETVSVTSKSEASATVESTEVTNVSSETVSKASSEAVKNLNSVTETVPSSEAPVEDSAMSETMIAPAPVKVTEAVTTNTNSLSALALLAYEVRYTDSEGKVVGKTAGLVTAESKDGVATKEVSFSADDIPSGYELAVGQSSVLTKQLVENQINILSFAVVKKSEEEEIAASQLANKEVLEQVVSEADLLADEALRQVAKEQAGNTSLEAVAQETKEVAKEAQVILNDASATQEVVDATVETVKASTLALADEILKVDGDGMLTAQLAVSSTNSATVSTNATYNVSFFEDMNSRVPDFVRVSNISVNGQTITYEIIVNESNSSGYGKAYHEFALGNEVDTTSVTIVRQQRSDANSAWVNDGSWNAGTWVGGEKEYFSRSNGNILGALYPYNNARDNTTGVEVDAANINNQVGTLYRDQLDVTTRAYKYTITATARDGKNPANMAFMAGFRAGTDNRAYYVATPGVTDPVGPEFKNTNSDRTTTPKDVYIWKDTPMRTEADLSVVSNGATINEIYFVNDDTSTRTGGGLTVSNAGKVSGQSNLAVGTHNVDSIIKYNNTSEVRSGDRFWIAVMDAVKTGDVTKNLGDSFTADSLKEEVLNKVDVQKGNIPQDWGSASSPNADWVTTKKIVNPSTGAEVTVPTTPGTHAVTVRVTNNQGRYKDVVVNVTIPNPNQATTGTDKEPLYIFTNTTIKTVDPGTNVDTSTDDDKVKVVNLQDPEEITSVEVTRETDVGTGVFTSSSIGITIDADGNASGTTNKGIGVYSRGLTVTDGTGAKTNLFPRNNEMETYVLDATAGEIITKAVGESVTEAEILDNVTVATGNSNTLDAAIDSRYRKVLAPDQKVPTTPGTHTVIVRVITKSNVYKDVPVTVVIPAPQKDGLTPAYAENVVAPGDSATTPPTFTNADGQPATAPTGATYAIPSSFTPPTGYTATIDPSTGAVTLTAPTGATVETVEVPVIVTYADNTTDSTSAVFKLDTDGDGQPDVADTDDDNDGIPDERDAQSKTPTTSAVTVNDATVVAGQPITPISVAVTTDDTQATVEVTGLPAGLTYNPTTKQIEGTPTGAEIPAGQDETTVTVTATVTDATGTPVTDTAVITIQRDTDGDGQPDVTDTDDDNDGIPDERDAQSKTPTTSAVTVNDATVVAGQPITPISVAVITDDTQATVEVTGLPAGLTYNPTTKQIEGTPTGAEIPAGQDETTVTVTATVTDATGTPVTDTAVITIQRDTDGDGQPDVTDTDDDNDGIPDTQDANPKDANTSAVTVNDATVVAGQPITPISVAVTTDDTQATVEVTGLPAGLTYNPTTKQIEGTPTGAEIPAGQDETTVTVTATVTDATGTPVTDTAVITIQRDTDGDGQPDVTDTDDDNDGIPDTQDANPKDANTSAVTVDDATVVSGQPITPISVAVTTDDTQATVEVTGLPAGLTYNPTTKQIEGTPTGAEIPAGQDETTVTVTATVTDATGTPVTDTAVITIQRDTDGDGQPDVTDTDDDNDGIPDDVEKQNGTDPKTPNTDTTVTPATVVEGQPVPDTT
ncbi:YSIRK-type signal peptide-containing protein, partial [Streptococcus suis]|nr:YSIRK-type signal peptide-containing protein [Streptococcus suis]